ncbi:hypothetical protein D5S18_29410 [Nocardia panacis]|uniref:Uncharacterized protein n=1 Tax=Nocardia panacis TaxID=2340916 RepID=A0A3A4KL37_9NOCA|nr:hypothetical protein [Nocardia panacis]RJO69989.1 hypothetical protein D5S18_29410 [Nocardia panacis]
MGAGTATITPGAPIPAAANGDGTASVVIARTATSSAPATGGGTTSAAVTVGYRWADSFDRADDVSLGTDWRIDRNGAPRIATNRAQMKTMNRGDGRAGCWASYQGGGAAAGRFGSDNYAVKAQLIAPVGNSATDNFTAIVLAVADAFGAGVMCYLVVSTGSGCGIVTQSGLPPSSGVTTDQTGQTVQASTVTNIAAGDLIEFRRVGKVFTAYRNGAALLTWTDINNIVGSGPTNRRWGFAVEGNYPLFMSEYRSPAVDSIQAYDL